VPLGPNVEPPLFIPRSEALFTAPRTKSSFRAALSVYCASCGCMSLIFALCIFYLLLVYYIVVSTGFCSPELADFQDLYVSSDEKLFNKILTCPNHILRTLLPPPTAQNYSLQNRPHNRQLPDRISRITDCNFTVGMLYRIMYQIIYILALRFSYSCLQLRFDSS